MFGFWKKRKVFTEEEVKQLVVAARAEATAETTTTTPPPATPEEPYVEIKSSDYDPEKGIRLELDWNEPFIDALKQNGFTGIDEDQLVQKWLAQTLRQMEIEMAERNKPNNESDYE